MLFKDLKKVFLCILVSISGIAALARADNWSHKRPNNTAVVQNQRGQTGYQPAVGFQQPLPQTQWNRYNQTQGQSQYNNNHHQQKPHPQWPQQNNRTQYGYQPAVPQGQQNPWIRNNQTQYYPQQPAYGQGSYNQTRPGFGSNNPTQYYPSQPTYGQGSYNQTRPAGLQYYPQQPAYGQGSYNQTRPGFGSNNPTQYYDSQPTYGQGSYNQNPAGPATNSHLYPSLPNTHNNIPVLPSSLWSPPANQTLVYPKLSNKPVPVQPNVGNNGIALAPLQPQNPQGPQISQPGGQAALSYGPGHYSQPAVSANNNPSVRQGSSNPYANIFN